MSELKFLNVGPYWQKHGVLEQEPKNKNKLLYSERKPEQLMLISCGSSIQVKLEFGSVGSVQEGEKPENLEKNPRSKAITNDKLNPHLTPGRN